MRRAMLRARTFCVLILLVVTVVCVFALPAVAQELPKLQTQSPPEGGICAPWHACVAYGALAMAGGAVLVFGLGYLVQSRGFDKLEHKQGNPEGVPVGKE